MLSLVVAAAAALLSGCGGSGGTAASGQTGVPEGQSTSSAKYAGIAAAPAKPAPPLALNDSLGHPVNIDQYRGKAVLVTFIYTHCPDVCPLIVGNLHTALAQLGSDAGKVQVIAVSVDPRGDTPSTVRAFLRAHRMTGRMEYLIGSRPQLLRTLAGVEHSRQGPTDEHLPRSGRAFRADLRDQRERQDHHLVPVELQSEPGGARRADPGIGLGVEIRRGLRIALVTVGAIAVVIGIVVLSGTSNRSGTGRPAPQLPTRVLVPPKVTVASLRGKPAAINFWASWCSPCQKEAPELERVAQALHGRASLVGVDWTDGTGAARSYVDQHHLTYPNLIDADGVTGQDYGLNGLPTTFIVDARGRITAVLRGPQTAGDLLRALHLSS